MRIAIATVQVPFIQGGAEVLSHMLSEELKKRGNVVEVITIPFKWYPVQNIIDSILMSQLVDITDVNGIKIDLMIGLKFPAYYIHHPNKTFWILHQHRQAYDLWGTSHGDLHNMENGIAVRDIINRLDNKYISQAPGVFTISKTTSDRLKNYNNIDSVPLYHPPMNHERLHSKSFGDYIFYPSRIDSIKRQLLLVEAAKYIKSPVRIILAGNGDERVMTQIKEVITKNNLGNKVVLLGYIGEEEKIQLYSECLAVYFGPYQEDYGYITLEAFFSSKPVITHTDSGGPLEFVRAETGFTIKPEPQLIAETIDRLYYHKELAVRLGRNGRQLMDDMHIDWDHVIKRLMK